MKAIVFDGTLKFIDDHPVPDPGKGEALVRVHMAGICNTDLELIKGYMGFRGVLGHEFVGRVEKINGGPSGLLGKRVVGEINIACGSCEYCASGMRTHCPRRDVLGILNKDGALAEYVTLPVENLHMVPDDVPDEEAVFTEPLAAAFEITEQTHIKPTDRVLVMGDGKLGILIALALNLSQAEVVLLGKHGSKLKIAGEQGVRTVLLEEFEAEGAYDIVVEATGSSRGFETALRLVKPRGTVVLKSTVAESREMNLSPLVIDEIHVVGSRCGPFAPALRALSRKLIDVRPLITHTCGFEQAEEAFNNAVGKDALKVLLDFR